LFGARRHAVQAAVRSPGHQRLRERVARGVVLRDLNALDAELRRHLIEHPQADPVVLILPHRPRARLAVDQRRGALSTNDAADVDPRRFRKGRDEDVKLHVRSREGVVDVARAEPEELGRHAHPDRGDELIHLVGVPGVDLILGEHALHRGPRVERRDREHARPASIVEGRDWRRW